MQKVINRYRYSIILLKQLVVTDFKLKYQSSFLGYLWSLLRPLALFIILYIVFVRFLRFGATVPNFAIYLLLGIVLWNFFADVTNTGVGAIVSKGDLLRKLNFPKYVIVLAGTISALINLSINLAVVFIFMLIKNVDFRWDGLLAAPLILELFVFSLAVAFFLSALFVRLRDVNYIWEVIMQALFYATPIIYPLSLVPAAAAKILLLNPVAQIIQDLRYVLVSDKSQTIGSIYGNSYMRLVPIGIVIFSAILATWYFRKSSPGFAEDI